jgi:hypothetical protein
MTVKKQSNKRTTVKTKATASVTAVKTESVIASKEKLPYIQKRKKAIDSFLSRRPHRSFRRTRRRDYTRSLLLPGYIALTREVQRTLWKNKRIFFGLTGIYALLSIVLIGIGSQDTFNTLSDTLKATGSGIFTGGFGAIGKASLLLAATLSGSISPSLTAVQQVYTAILSLMAWLATIWLLRNILAGNKPRLRDGLYSSGSPILATFIVAIFLVLQLIPLALAIIGYSAANSSGLLNNGIEGFIFVVAAGLFVILSLYWVTATIFSLVIVTLPGMYPYRAIRSAGDLVIGRRVRLLLRFLWMIFMVALFWAIVMIPLILIDTGISGALPTFKNIPVIPFALIVMSSLTIVWVSTYVYLLYRKVVADDASPA